MKNLFAYNSAGDLIHISKVDKSIKDIFTCVNCGSELIARKGKIKAHHFAHKAVLDCNYETYLHKLGKIVFLQTYNQCIKKGIPFYIEYISKHRCSTCETNELLKRSCSFGSKKKKFDLTSRYNLASIEKRFNGFVADILLESTKPEIYDKIFIEIAVSHNCEFEKQKSGIRIIEIKLNNEEDIKIIKEKYFRLGSKNLTFYNFKANINDKKIPLNQCNKEFEVFSVLKSKKAIKRKVKAKDIQKISKDKNYIYNKILSREHDNFGGKKFAKLVKEASHRGIDVKNCFACRYFDYNKNSKDKTLYFCSRLKLEFDNTNNGANCNKFWRIPKPTHYKSNIF